MPDFQSRHAGEMIDDAVDMILASPVTIKGAGVSSSETPAARLPGLPPGAVYQVAYDYDDNTVTPVGTWSLEDAFGDGPKDLYMALPGSTGITLIAHLFVDGNGAVVVDYVQAAEDGGDVNGGTYDVYNSFSTEASGDYASASGRNTVASGLSSHAAGNLTVASGENAHAQGDATIASGKSAHASGGGSVASGDNSYAGGSASQATAMASFAHGHLCVAEGSGSAAFGANAFAAQGLALGHSASASARAQSIIQGGIRGSQGDVPFLLLETPIAPGCILRFTGTVLVRTQDYSAFQTGTFSGLVTRQIAGAPVLSNLVVTWDGGVTTQGTLSITVDADGLRFTTAPSNNTQRVWAVDVHGLEMSPE